MKSNRFSTFYNSFYTSLTIIERYKELKYPQLVVFSLILAILEQTGTCTQAQVVKANYRQNKGYCSKTTIEHINKLNKHGFIVKERSNQYFSYSYLILTKKGLLLKSRLSTLLSSPLDI